MTPNTETEPTRLDGPDLSPERIRELLTRPTSFAYFGDLPIGDSWSLGPVILTRDSGPLDESNAATLKKELTSDPTLAEDWTITRASHWAVGWVEHLSFRVVEPDGSASRVARFLEGWFESLSDYPVADDDDHSEREHESALESWDFWGYRDAADHMRKVFGLSETTRDFLADDSAALLDMLQPETTYEGDQPYYDAERAIDALARNGGDALFSYRHRDGLTPRAALARWIREERKRRRSE